MCKEGRRSGCGCGGSRAGGQLTAAGGFRRSGRPPGSTSPQPGVRPSEDLPSLPLGSPACVRILFQAYSSQGQARTRSGRGCLHVLPQGGCGPTKEQHRVLFRPHVPLPVGCLWSWSGDPYCGAREEGRGSKGRAVKKPVWSLLCRRSPAPPGLRRLTCGPRSQFTTL